MKLDRIIFGDNQFFGINHMSEEKAQLQAQRFKDIRDIIKVIDIAYDCGIRAFMFNTHDRVAQICDYLRASPEKYSDISLYPSMPYAHKYANKVNEKGIMGALNDVLFSGNTSKQLFKSVKHGITAVTRKDIIELMKFLIDAEVKMFRGLNVKVFFLQNIVTDLLLGMKFKNVFIEYTKYIKENYGVEPGFITLNMPTLVDFLLDCGIENPIVCTGLNKKGYLMNPNIESYENTLKTREFRSMAMSILASGAIPPNEAVKYVVKQPQIQSIVFGASSKSNIQETKRLIESYDNLKFRIDDINIGQVNDQKSSIKINSMEYKPSLKKRIRKAVSNILSLNTQQDNPLLKEASEPKI
jgi:hypothetical protein